MPSPYFEVIIGLFITRKELKKLAAPLASMGRTDGTFYSSDQLQAVRSSMAAQWWCANCFL
jgi:hypothetical protein